MNMKGKALLAGCIALVMSNAALAEGLLLLTCGVYGNVIRFLYPLTIPDAQFRQALAIIQRALAA